VEEEGNIRADACGGGVELAGADGEVEEAAEAHEDGGGVAAAAAETGSVRDVFFEMDGEAWKRAAECGEAVDGLDGEVGAVRGQRGICAGKIYRSGGQFGEQGDGEAVAQGERDHAAGDLVESVWAAAVDGQGEIDFRWSVQLEAVRHEGEALAGRVAGLLSGLLAHFLSEAAEFFDLRLGEVIDLDDVVGAVEHTEGGAHEVFAHFDAEDILPLVVFGAAAAEAVAGDDDAFVGDDHGIRLLAEHAGFLVGDVEDLFVAADEAAGFREDFGDEGWFLAFVHGVGEGFLDIEDLVERGPVHHAIVEDEVGSGDGTVAEEFEELVLVVGAVGLLIFENEDVHGGEE
jgi:hypothetical protein